MTKGRRSHSPELSTSRAASATSASSPRRFFTKQTNLHSIPFPNISGTGRKSSFPLRSTVQDEPCALNYVVRRPVGVAGLIIPWNLPLLLLSFKLAPAIAAGNTVVILKPSELTSVSAWLLCHVFAEAGSICCISILS